MRSAVAAVAWLATSIWPRTGMPPGVVGRKVPQSLGKQIWIAATIPSATSRARTSASGRSTAAMTREGRCRGRNVVERCSNKLKQTETDHDVH